MTNNEQNDESFISHLEALRKTLLNCLYSIVIVLPFALFLAPKVLNYLIKIIISSNNIKLNYFSPVEVFMLQIKMALVLSIIICFPYIAKQLWDFILPALYSHEKKFIKSIVLISFSLFIIGVIFAIFVILPLIVSFGLSFSTDTIQAILGISNIINLVMWMSVVFGLMFQIPIITYYLIKSEIVEYSAFADKRRYIAVIILILSAILTPPDIISQLVLGLPTYFLFEAGLLFAKIKNIKKSEVDI